jgi:GNAT superfamily N-acetyltransferase
VTDRPAAEVRVVPADEATWEDLQAVLGTRGAGSRCQCQRYRLGRGESFGSFPEEERADRLRQQADPGHPGGPTSGLVGFLGPDPVGWCAVAPRSSYDGLVRVFRVPWEGRDEDRTDPSVWAVTCVFTRAGFRRRGVSRAMVAATVDHARERGARALEGYPITTTDVISEELHVGTLASFEAAGFRVVGRPSPRRVVVRIDF